jgi:Rad3-related DNA helicase
MGNNLVSVVDSLPIVRDITDIIIDKNRENAKTERLEIEADVYKCRIVEESKRFLAELEKRDRENERNYNLKIAELNLKLAEDIREFNLKMKALECDSNDKSREIEMKNKVIEKNNDMLSTLLEYFKLNPQDKEISEMIKFFSRTNLEILNSIK